ncbi:hypothetical protein AB0G06_40725 [Nonomuraea dietziae]|uniref:hypothetical protein n=1 Tax=Nonomuraea dietziae TaxID=65515 RepID=UPI0033CE14A1
MSPNDVDLVDNATAAVTIAPFTDYPAQPAMTVYLHTDLDELTARMSVKPDQSEADRDLIADRELLSRIEDHYDDIARTDPTACHLHTDGRTPAELADHIADMVHVMAKAGAAATHT